MGMTTRETERIVIPEPQPLTVPEPQPDQTPEPAPSGSLAAPAAH
jgi:hypothetical protein